PLPMTLKPRAPWFQGAQLSCYPDCGAVYTLDLDFTSEARPTVQELRTVFGKDQPVVLSLHGQRTTIFYPPSKIKRWSGAFIADLSRCFDRHSSADPPPGPC